MRSCTLWKLKINEGLSLVLFDNKWKENWSKCLSAAHHSSTPTSKPFGDQTRMHPPIRSPSNCGPERSCTFQDLPSAKKVHFSMAPLLSQGFLAMLSFLVPIEDGPLVEAPPAGRTVVGLLPSVDPLVSDQPLPFTEPLPTHLAPVRLLACVGSPVHSQVCVPAKALATLTGVGLFPRVSSPMHLQMLPPAEAFPAVTTLVGLLPCVTPLVDLKVVPLAEGLPALTAHIGSLSQVCSLVLHEVLSQGESLPTFNAPIGFLLFMSSLVSDKI